MVRKPHNPLDATNRPNYLTVDDSDIIDDVIVYDGSEQSADKKLATIIADGWNRLGLKIRSIFCKHCTIKPAETSATPLYRTLRLPLADNPSQPPVERNFRILTESDAKSLRPGDSVYFADYDTKSGNPVSRQATVMETGMAVPTSPVDTFVRLSYSTGYKHEYSFWNNGVSGGVTLLKPL